MPKGFYVLGVDPGMAHFGLALVQFTPGQAIVERVAVLETLKEDKRRNVNAPSDNTRRTREVYRFIKHQTDGKKISLICAESVSFPRGASAAGKMSLSWGALIGWAEEREIPISELSPQAIKVAAVGKKSASKAEIQAAMEIINGAAACLNRIKPGHQEHGADALAAVFACQHSNEIRVLRQSFAA